MKRGHCLPMPYRGFPSAAVLLGGHRGQQDPPSWLSRLGSLGWELGDRQAPGGSLSDEARHSMEMLETLVLTAVAMQVFARDLPEEGAG